MKLAATLCALAVVGLTSTPAFALFCIDEGPSAGLTFESGSGDRLRRDNDAQRELDLRRLREVGVNATSVERWNGCMRAFVRQPGGGETMEFYDPASLRRLQ